MFESDDMNKNNKDIIYDLKTIFTFGKYKGKSVKTILNVDKSYIAYMHQQGTIKITEDIKNFLEGFIDSDSEFYSELSR
jgi:hypothetical protein